MVETDSFDVLSVPVPFAMRPGLQRLAAAARHLSPLTPKSALAQEKRAAWAKRDLCLIAPGFDEAAALVSRALLAQCQHDAIPLIASDDVNTGTEGQYQSKNATSSSQPELKALFQRVSLSVEEDFAVLDARPSSLHRTGLPLICVACPSHWRPEEKIGLPLAAVHAPVADNALLVKASEGLASLATNGEHWQRWVWTITPSRRFDAHPDRHPERVWPIALDPADFASACFLRSERQSFFPVLGSEDEPSGLAIFTIRVQITPLREALATPAHARSLHDSIASMSPAVLQYKGLASARNTLLSALESMAAVSAESVSLPRMHAT